MITVLKRIARQLERIAVEVENAEKLSSLSIIKRIRQDFEDIEKDIDDALTLKASQDNTDYILSRFYRNSESALIAIKHTIQENLISPKSQDIQNQINESINIRNILLRIIKKLDSYYKNHLNPKFKFHGITHTMLNQRLNELKQIKRDLDLSINNLEKGY
jgi:hypothetical protein